MGRRLVDEDMVDDRLLDVGCGREYSSVVVLL